MPYTFKDIPASCQIGILSELYENHVGYKTDGFFVEIGAFDGYSWSNTLPLIETGWSGIMVEPDPINFGMLCQHHLSNKKLTLVQAAVGDVSMSENGMVKLYQGGSTSTIIPSTVDVYRSIPDLAIGGLDRNRFVMVPVHTMNTTLALYECPKRFDVLVIDVEGGEMDVLNGYDISQHRPKMAIVEAHEKSPYPALRPKAGMINRYFKLNGYQRIYSDSINNIYVSRKW